MEMSTPCEDCGVIVEIHDLIETENGLMLCQSCADVYEALKLINNIS